jgi:UDP-glucose 4-epimerase
VVDNVLITGGCGFIGLNLIEYILQQSNYEANIRVIDNLSVGRKSDLQKIIDIKEIHNPKNSPIGVELLEGNIRNPEVCNVAMAGIDNVIHLAANTGVQPSIKNPEFDFETNTIGTFNLLVAARNNKVNKFIFASSGASVGECKPPIHEEVTAHPISPYGAGKLCGEAYCSAFNRSYGLETISLRFSNVYGPKSYNKSSVVAKVINRAIKGERIEVNGDGKQTRDFIFVLDLVRAILSSLKTKTKGGQIFQIATGEETSINSLIQIISNQFEIEKKFFPEIVYKDKMDGDVIRNFSLIKKANQELNWFPESSINDGIFLTIEDFLKIE